MTRITSKEALRQKARLHSVPDSPPRAARPKRCSHGELVFGRGGVFLGDPDNRVDSGDFEDWTPELGRVEFSLSTAQLHRHPEALDFLTECLALIVWFWEKNYSAKHAYWIRQKGGARVLKHDPSPYTSLDVQRFALLTLEQNPSISITDLLWAAQQPDLDAPTPKYFLRVLKEEAHTACLSGSESCREGLHDLGADRILARLPKQTLRLDQAPPSKSRERPSAYSLSERFHEKTSHLAPMGGNKRALAAHIKKWMNDDGLGYGAVDLMIDEFVDHSQMYWRKGDPPWRRFISKRNDLLNAVEEHWTDMHQWDPDYDPQHAKLFGKYGAIEDD